MSVNFNKVLSNRRNLPCEQWQMRAAASAAKINDKATDVELIRNGTKLAPQPVRIAVDSRAREFNGPNGRVSIRAATIFGVRGHADLDDTDITRGDRFYMDDVEYTVVNVNRELIGAIQADAEAVL